ncbi:hypothetical protein [Vibrio sp. 10N.286.48.B7]|uniref:hypothetical protein n=1 Tax=Vibrio sp. 10N.286.48.B7 TaxID=1880853 RepID=UPI0039A40659
MEKDNSADLDSGHDVDGTVVYLYGPLPSVTMGARILSGVIAGFTFYISSECFLVRLVWFIKYHRPLVS